ncbi:hypothetical protein ACLQ3B_24785 [Micromonospora sp. DT53]|uniref:hypothetical protein n=1 Tax=Micromonospora sp. DT53 TaxID=3393444 RepID=UPI003CEF67C1
MEHDGFGVDAGAGQGGDRVGAVGRDRDPVDGPGEELVAVGQAALRTGDPTDRSDEVVAARHAPGHRVEVGNASDGVEVPGEALAGLGGSAEEHQGPVTGTGHGDVVVVPVSDDPRPSGRVPDRLSSAMALGQGRR